MNPRYKVSKKWTAFPLELTHQISAIFEQNFSTNMGSKITLNVHGRIYQKEILLRVGLQNKGELRYFNFETSVDLTSTPTQPAQEEQIFAQISLAVDCIGSMMAEYFENEQELELPYIWTETIFEKKKLWVQHSTVNPKLEEEADKLLGQADEDTLLKNADDEKSDDILDATEEEFDEFAEHLSTEPQMFKKKKKDDLH